MRVVYVLPTLRRNKLRDLLKQGKPTIGTHVHSTWPGTMEVIGHSSAVDYVEFVSTYAPYHLYSLDNLGMASELFDMSTMIKIDAEPKTYLAQRAVGAGFQSVLFADLRTVKDVEEAVRAVRAEPKGWNGCAMQRIEGYLLDCGSEKFAKYCDDVVIAIMIEKKSLYDRLEDVMNTEGVDMIQFGPCDFSMSLGLWGQTRHDKVLEAEKKTIKMALKYDKHPRAEIDSIDGFEEKLKGYVNLGVRDFCVGSELVILYEWLKKYAGITRKALDKT
jgi:2-keto-3-deoxy-L-rhamnonate aldolase RhmA